MSHRQDYIESEIRGAIDTVPEVNPELAVKLAGVIFNALEKRRLLEGTTLDDSAFAPDQSIGDPPYGAQLKKAPTSTPLYWMLVDALVKEYEAEEISTREMAIRHGTSTGTMVGIMNRAGVSRPKGGRRTKEDPTGSDENPKEGPQNVSAPRKKRSKSKDTQIDRPTSRPPRQPSSPRKAKGPDPLQTNPYKNAHEYMKDLRAVLLEKDIRATGRPAYAEHIEPMLLTGQDQCERDVQLLLPRLNAYIQQCNVPDKVRAESKKNLEEGAKTYTEHMARLLMQLGSVVLELQNRHSLPSFTCVLTNTELRDKVIRYVSRNHRRLVWELAGHKPENINASEIRSTFSLYHPAEDVLKLRKEYAALGASIVDFTVVNSPRKIRDVLESAHQSYERLGKIERYEVLGDGTIKEIIRNNPANPDRALEDALTAFNEAIADPENSMFTKGDIRNIVSRSHVTLADKLRSARTEVRHLRSEERYERLEERFIARHTLLRPKKIRLYLDEIIKQLDLLDSVPEISRFKQRDILLLIEGQPVDALDTMAQAMHTLKRIEQDPECSGLDTDQVPIMMFKNQDAYEQIKQAFARPKTNGGTSGPTVETTNNAQTSESH